MRTRLVTLALLGSLGCRASQAPSPTPVSPSPSPATAERPLPEPLPNVAATVNGQPIWIRLVSLYVQKTHPKQVISPLEKPAVYREALERCIDRELLFQEAVAQGLSPSDAEIQTAYDQARVHHPSDADWTQFLADQRLTVDTFRMEIRTEKTVAILLRRLSGTVPPVTEEEARTYFEQHPSVFETGERLRARLIVVHNPLMTAAGRAKMRERLLPAFVRRLRKGEDFVSVARKADTDASWETAGQIRILRRAELPDAVADAAFRLKPGELTDFIDTPQGFELVKVEEKLPSERLTYEQAAPRLKMLLTEQKQTEALEKVVGGLKAKARVERSL